MASMSDEIRKLIVETMDTGFSKQEKLFQGMVAESMDKILKLVEGLKTRVKKIEQRQDDLEKSLEFTQDLHTKDIQTLQEKHVEQCNLNLENIAKLNEQIRKLEDRNRRNNLRIDGIKENDGETWQDTEKKVLNILEKKLNVTNVAIERAHRMGKLNSEDDRPRTIIFKLLNYKDKQLILGNAKQLSKTGMYINEDFSDETNKIRKDLRVRMKKAREEGKYSIISYDKLIIRNFRTNKHTN